MLVVDSSDYKALLKVMWKTTGKASFVLVSIFHCLFWTGYNVGKFIYSTPEPIAATCIQEIKK